jgi:hypothetical protein
MLLNSQAFLILAVAMLVGLHPALRVAAAASDLRRKGLAAASPDDQTIPPAVAEQIIERLQKGSKRPQSAKLLAQQTLSVFESLNMRPPGWLASIGLLSAHALGVCATLVFGVVFVMAQHGTLSSMLHAAATRPPHRIVQPITIVASGAREKEPTEAATIIATFRNASAARAAYDEASARLGPRERATLLADTLMVRIAVDDTEARNRWFDDLRAKSTGCLTHTAATRATFRFQAIARTEKEAKAIHGVLSEYFGLSTHERLIAPWSAARLDPDQQRARATYARLRDAHISSWRDPEVKAIRSRMTEAMKRGDQSRAQSLSSELHAAGERQAISRLRAIAQESGPQVHQELANRYVELVAARKPDDNRPGPDLGRELAAYLGRAPADDPTPALSGWARQSGLIVSLQYICFADPGPGAEALVRWLDAKGCTYIRYDVDPEPVDEGEEP